MDTERQALPAPFSPGGVRKAVWKRQNKTSLSDFNAGLLNLVTRRVVSLQVALCGINGPVNRAGRFSG